MSAKCQLTVHAFGGLEIDLSRRELRALGYPVELGGRAFDILEVLLQFPGEFVAKEELIARVWPGRIVEENTLQVHISAIRRALGADRGLLETTSGRGYRLLGPWTVRQGGPAAEPNTAEFGAFGESGSSGNLPVASFELIGRTAALEELHALLAAHRVVTLTGPGGIGKSALALEAARARPSDAGDAWLVELASLSDPGLVPSAVSGALGLRLAGDEISADAVARAIAGRQSLLVLDNCEHIIDEAARLGETLVRICPNVKVLATSREVLRIEGEYVFRVPPLDVPDADAADEAGVLRRSAVQLFVSRMGPSGRDVPLQAEELAAIAEICRRLDGIPLALEFAAGRTGTLGIGEVAARLGDRFALLTGGRRTALPRHQTLRAVLDWSYELLSGPEQRLLRRLAVFPAAFCLDAAMAVATGGDISATTILDGIANLVAKSLVALDGSTPLRQWRLLETTRAYALEKLQASGEAGDVSRRHAAYYRDLIARSPPDPPVQSANAVRPQRGHHIHDVRAALGWCFSPAGDATIGVELAAAYVPVWTHLALMVECRERVEQALGSLGPDSDLNARLRMQLHIAFGVALFFTMGSAERTRAAFAEAHELARAVGDPDARLRTMRALWAAHFNTGEARAAFSMAEQLVDLAGDAGEPAAARLADRLMGNTLHHLGRQREAQLRFESALAHDFGTAGAPPTIWLHYDHRVLAGATLARSLWLQGFADQALARARASLEEAEASGSRVSMREALRLAACPVAFMCGDYDGAERAAATLIELATIDNATFWNAMGRCLEGQILIGRGNFAAGLARLRAALDACERTGWTLWHPMFLGTVAEGLAGLEQFPEALAMIDRAIETAKRGGEVWYLPELLRLKGEILLQEWRDPSIAAAERCLEEAMEMARGQDALSWELRAATSLARLRIEQNRGDDAWRVLAPIHGRFTEGFATADLRAAEALLALLTTDPPDANS